MTFIKAHRIIRNAPHLMNALAANEILFMTDEPNPRFQFCPTNDFDSEHVLNLIAACQTDDEKLAILALNDSFNE